MGFQALRGLETVFNSQVDEAAKKHAQEQYPNESCGVVIDDTYIPLENVSKTPWDSFEFKRSEISQLGEIQAIIHSHPDGNPFPSAADMQGQIASNVPWGIVYCKGGLSHPPFYWGDSLPIQPLKGRVFQHGITDCYSLIRDYFRLHRDIVLDEFPRDWNWWLKPGFDLYAENFKTQKFRIIDSSEVKEGDCFLAQIRSKVINHAGVYVGRGLILHQLGDRSGYSGAFPSCEQPVSMWQKYIRHWVRCD